MDTSVDFVGQTGGFIMRYRQRPLAASRTMLAKNAGNSPRKACGCRDALPCWRPALRSGSIYRNGGGSSRSSSQRHPWRPSTYSQLTNHFWTVGFQQYDAANWRAPVEFRYPYFDTRLVRYLLRVPVLPWFSNKALLREAMRGRLPEIVRKRPKAPLAGEPNHPYADWVRRDNSRDHN